MIFAPMLRDNRLARDTLPGTPFVIFESEAAPMSTGKTVVVHNFTFVDTNTIAPKLGAGKCTAEKIVQNKHDIVPGTAETVDTSLVDDTGKYRPEWAAGGAG